MRHVACLSFSALLACAPAPEPFSCVDDFDCLNGTRCVDNACVRDGEGEGEGEGEGDVVCGDGAIGGAEACDDDNDVGGDGCAADCGAVEDGFVCPDAGAECVGIFATDGAEVALADSITFIATGTSLAALTGRTLTVDNTCRVSVAQAPAPGAFDVELECGGATATVSLIAWDVESASIDSTPPVPKFDLDINSGQERGPVVSCALTLRKQAGIVGVDAEVSIPAVGDQGNINATITSDVSGSCRATDGVGSVELPTGLVVRVAPQAPTYQLAVRGGVLVWDVLRPEGSASCTLVADGTTLTVTEVVTDPVVDGHAFLAPTSGLGKFVVRASCSEGVRSTDSVETETVFFGGMVAASVTDTAINDATVVIGDVNLDGNGSGNYLLARLEAVSGFFKVSARNNGPFSVNFPALRLVAGNFEFLGNSGLATMTTTGLASGGASFPLLAEVDGDFTITNNDDLTSTAAGPGGVDDDSFANLTRVGGDLTIQANNALATVTMASLTDVVGNFTVQNNAQLNVANFDGLTSVGGPNVTISGNGVALLCEDRQSIGCDVGIAAANVSLGGGCNCP